MSAQQWNERHPVGTRVIVTLANGHTLQTRTVSPARSWGGLDHVEVAGLAGFVLLGWVRELERSGKSG